ncbi:hypothetical protein COLO4_27941 [Corchorus olitorius]|uniref:non-specific serine/threonine protein kinase n=1 Tax=Corchorus olitorius TaxID=93759 RepID=A0A1R3HNL5_9ROSI|nr:hypothetical protein COLO4_27941 [Corchorus olitorius]
MARGFHLLEDSHTFDLMLIVKRKCGEINFKHAIFLSFYGEDTGTVKNFADHLDSALNREGLQTFKDDKSLERGENFTSERHESIFIENLVKEISEIWNAQSLITSTGIDAKYQALITSLGREFLPQLADKLLVEEEDKYPSSESRVDNKTWPDLNKLVYHGTDGRTIGKLHILSKEIAKGSNETSVLEGFYDGREVAVKSLRLTHHDIALKEIELLRASDWHQNIVRWYGFEYDENFVYLALERCICSVGGLIQILSPPESETSQISTSAMIEYKNRLNALKNELPLEDLSLWKANGHPSPLLLKLMKDIVLGLAHLHRLEIIHRDLKPQNVLLLIKDKIVCAKIADMGISKRLPPNHSSLGSQATGKPKTLMEVWRHPLFWNSEERLSFLEDASERLESENWWAGSVLLRELENTAPLVLGGNWNREMEPEFIADLLAFRNYKFGRVQDLLRAIRNKSSHYVRLPPKIQNLLGPYPEGYYDYFDSKFPKLFIEVYKLVYTHCREEDFFKDKEYFKFEGDVV